MRPFESRHVRHMFATRHSLSAEPPSAPACVHERRVHAPCFAPVLSLLVSWPQSPCCSLSLLASPARIGCHTTRRRTERQTDRQSRSQKEKAGPNVEGEGGRCSSRRTIDATMSPPPSSLLGGSARDTSSRANQRRSGHDAPQLVVQKRSKGTGQIVRRTLSSRTSFDVNKSLSKGWTRWHALCSLTLYCAGVHHYRV